MEIDGQKSVAGLGRAGKGGGTDESDNFPFSFIDSSALVLKAKTSFSTAVFWRSFSRYSDTLARCTALTPGSW